MLRDNIIFACLDDKRKIPVGESGYPVASVKRGRRVIVSRNIFFSSSPGLDSFQYNAICDSLHQHPR